ncbi:MAG: D-alanine--D-alanine ligase [Bacilli bacterium]|nr:D-alanine--D-alanine ligase [Bacilli bacterium]
MMKIRVGVIFGGESVEHEVSIISAIQAMKAINSNKYEIVPIYISKEREWYTGNLLKDIDNYKDLDNLKKFATKVVLYNKGNRFILQSKGCFKRMVNEIDIAFPIVHGTNVEDGTLQGYLSILGIPYVGSHVASSAVGQDKVFMKQIFAAEDIPIADYLWFFENEYLDNTDEILKKIDKLGYPVMVKPATLGSSIGITKVNQKENIQSAIEEALQYDNKVIIEEVVNNLVEVNCSVLGNYEYQQTSEIEEVISSDEFLTYQDKYMGNAKGSKSKGMASTNRVIPARIDDEMRKEVRRLAKEVFRVLNTAGVARVDFLIDNKKNKIYVTEINTIPGSLAFYLWDPIGKSYPDLLDELISLAIRDYKKQGKIVYTFNNNLLNNFGGLKGCKGIKGKLGR